MRIRIDRPNELDGDTVFTPIDPPMLFDISSVFELVGFTSSATSAPPFSQLTVNWTIRPIDQATQVEDYQFRLVVFQNVELNAIEAQGSAPFMLMANTRAVISGRKVGGAWSTFDQEVIISLDEIDCQKIEHYGPFVDDAVFSQLHALLASTKELRLRQEFLPANPQNPIAPHETIEMKPTSDWTVERIRYKFPLEIVIENFFDADLDVQMDLRFQMEHDPSGSTLAINIDFEVDADFSLGENILSVGSTSAISKTLNKVLPMVFDCRKSEIEAEIGRRLIDDRVRTALNTLSDGRVYDVRIEPRSATSIGNYIVVVVCPTSEESEADDADPVVVRT